MMAHTGTHPTAHRDISAEMQHCIQACENCHHVCTRTVTHCLHMGGRHAEAGHIGLLLDCAEICQTSASFMLRGSDLHARICQGCAEICERCAQDCEQFGDDPHMQRCALACRSCAESCRKMAAVM